ncbi:MAG: hypothetical protein JXR83_07095 [Deltaproteobacteria bacterium]|nr:hypothetical protein [Deltaproteobacteria bacterium]
MTHQHTSGQNRALMLAAVQRLWSPVIQSVVAACHGDLRAAQRVEFLIEQLGEQDDWRRLTAVLRRIVQGERDAANLLAGLDTTDTLIASNVLQRLGVDLTAVLDDFVPLPDLPEVTSSNVFLVDFIGRAVDACRPDAGEDEVAEVRGMLRALSENSELPDDLQILGVQLTRALDGETADLTRLTPELAGLVQGKLATLLAAHPEVGEA